MSTQTLPALVAPANAEASQFIENDKVIEMSLPSAAIPRWTMPIADSEQFTEHPVTGQHSNTLPNIAWFIFRLINKDY